jgi:transcriptional regulator with XRE-family HTH domain
VGIRSEFGQRVRELRARSGMSQEMLAFRSVLDRSYISGVESGLRNVSIVNIDKIAAALSVSVAYMFSGEKFSTNLAYQQKDFNIPFKERFMYSLDSEKKLLSLEVIGLFSGKEDVDYLSSVILGVCSTFRKGELNILIDHREMKTGDGEAAVYSPEVIERAVVFQRKLTTYSNKVVALCNSEFMVHQLNHVATESGIIEKAIHLFGKGRDMIDQAYEILDIHGNELIKAEEQNHPAGDSTVERP